MTKSTLTNNMFAFNNLCRGLTSCNIRPSQLPGTYLHVAKGYYIINFTVSI